MHAEQRGAYLSALFVDYDNVYLSLRRRNEEAAARFAQQPARWLTEIVSGRLVRSEYDDPKRRRLAVSRVYGNPVPRRAGRDGANDPNSFIFVRHHFIRTGFEVIDCPPLTTQLKNGADIRMAIDIRDFLEHHTKFDEFIILSGDADFTPVLHRLRSFDRRTVIYSNDHTAAPYAALCDGRVDEAELTNFLLEEALPSPEQDRSSHALEHQQGQSSTKRSLTRARQSCASGTNEEPTIRALVEDFKVISKEILNLVVDVVNKAEKPVPIAYLANRAMKELGHPKTVGTNWAGSGGFLNFLSQKLPDDLRLTESPPHCVYDPARHKVEESEQQAAPDTPARTAKTPETQPQPDVLRPAQNAGGNRLSELQESITRIYEASKAPPLPPSEYQLLFSLISTEVREHGFHPDRTVSAVVSRAAEAGVRLAVPDVGFVIAAVDEVDPWLEQSQSPAAIARAYRDNILSRCKAAGLGLTDDEHQLIQVWFGANQWGNAFQGNDDMGQAGQPDNRRQLQREEPSYSGAPSLPHRPEIPLSRDFGLPSGPDDQEDSDTDMEAKRSFAGMFKRHG